MSMRTKISEGCFSTLLNLCHEALRLLWGSPTLYQQNNSLIKWPVSFFYVYRRVRELPFDDLVVHVSFFTIYIHVKVSCENSIHSFICVPIFLDFYVSLPKVLISHELSDTRHADATFLYVEGTGCECLVCTMAEVNTIVFFATDVDSYTKN